MNKEHDSKGAEQFGQHKIFSHLDRIQNWQSGKTETLVTTKIDMTNECDSHCPGCVGGRSEKQASLTKDQAFYAIDQISDLGSKSLIFSGGGEPLMNPHTPSAIKYAKSKGLDVGVITNGLRLRNSLAEVILENCTWIRVTVDASDPETYLRMHGANKEEFERVVRNIGDICKEKQRMGSTCTIGAGYLTKEDTLKGMEEFAKLGKRLGVDYIQFRPFHGDFTPIDKQLREAKRFEDDSFKIVTSEQKYSRFDDEDKRPYSKCLGMDFIGIISAEMDVYTCCHARGKKEYIIGNLNETPLREIWENREHHPLWGKITPNCPFFCEADTHNRVLANITRPKQHVNFI